MISGQKKMIFKKKTRNLHKFKREADKRTFVWKKRKFLENIFENSAKLEFVSIRSISILNFNVAVRLCMRT